MVSRLPCLCLRSGSRGQCREGLTAAQADFMQNRAGRTGTPPTGERLDLMGGSAAASHLSLARRGWSCRYCDTLSQARPGAEMKVNIEIDCTPSEARQFFGLPDVAPMQTAVMDKLQQQMTASLDKI